SRRRHTRCLSDWSSDVCSSDLSDAAPSDEMGLSISADGEWLAVGAHQHRLDSSEFAGTVYLYRLIDGAWTQVQELTASDVSADRSEERRVGKECVRGGEVRDGR